MNIPDWLVPDWNFLENFAMAHAWWVIGALAALVLGILALAARFDQRHSDDGDDDEQLKQIKDEVKAARQDIANVHRAIGLTDYPWHNYVVLPHERSENSEQHPGKPDQGHL